MEKTIGNFTFHETKLSGVYLIDTKVFGDARGYFMKTYRKGDFNAAGLRCDFVQNNQSCSRKGVARAR